MDIGIPPRGNFRAVLRLALGAACCLPMVALAQIRTGQVIEVDPDGINPGSPAIAIHEHGGFVIVWEKRAAFGFGDEGVRLQRFDAAGTRLGDEVALSDRGMFFEHSYLRGPAVAADGAGGFLVAWEHAADLRVRLQRFDSSGLALAPAQRIDRAPFEQCSPSIAVGQDGAFVLAWLRREAEGDEVVTRRYDPMGRPLGEAQVVDAAPRDFSSGRRLHDPRVALAADGKFRIVWSHPDGYVGMRRYGADGIPEGPPGAASSSAFPIEPPRPAIAMAPDGRAVVVWTPTSGYGPAYNSPPGVWARIFDAAGNGRGDEFQLDSGNSRVDSAAVALTPDGGFIATWVAHTPRGSGVHGQRVDAEGRSIGGEFVIIPPRSAGSQAMAMRGNGSFVVVAGPDTYGTGPTAQRLVLGELPTLSLARRNVTMTEGESAPIQARLDGAAGVPFQVYFREDTTGTVRSHDRHFSAAATQRRLLEFSPPQNTRPQPARQYTLTLYPPRSGVAGVPQDASRTRITVLDDD